MRFPRFQLPKFSISDVLLVTAAAAVALATATGSRPSGDPNFGLYAGSPSLIINLLAFASLLLAVELVRHARTLLAQRAILLPAHRTHLALAIATRVGVACGIWTVAIILLLVNRTTIDVSPSVDEYYFGSDLWNGLLLILFTVVAARLLTNPSPRSSTRGLWVDIPGKSLITVGVLTYTAVVLWNQQIVVMLVHMATEGVELAGRARWHRAGTFPNHMLEGYRTFYTTLLASLLLLGAFLSLWGASRSRRVFETLSFALLFLLTTAVVGWFALWFEWREFPRISPDLAAAPAELSRWGMVGIRLVALGLAHLWGMVAARHPSTAHDEPPTIVVRERSWLVIIGGVAIVGYTLWSLVDTLLVLNSFGSFFQSTTFWDLVESFSWMLWTPEEFLKLILLPFGLVLAWQSARRPELHVALFRFSLGSYTLHFLAALGLLTVAIPTLKALGFAMWIGPTWRPF